MSKPAEGLLNGLNKEQTACVQQDAQVLQILAGPGSGKTRVLTARVALMVSERKIDPEKIIVVTFSNKAARELKERLTASVGNNVARRLIIGTFHAVALRYLQRYGVTIGLPQRIMVADASESRNVVAKVLKKLKNDAGDEAESMTPGTALAHLSKLKCHGVGPEDVSSFVKARNGPVKLAPSLVQVLVKVYQAYQDHLQQHDLLDFDDLLIQGIRLLKQMPQLVSRIQHVFVDEFQDTSSVQFELMALFAQQQQTLTVVGDHDQSIYSFRAADIRNFARMHEHYNCTEHYLHSNYRSSGSIVFAATALIEQDNQRPAKQLAAQHEIGPQPCLRVLQTAANEADWLATEISRLLSHTGDLIQREDVAVLVRSASLTLPIEQALQRHRIPYKLANARKFLERPHIRILIGYLRVIQDPRSPALLEIVNKPGRKFGDKSVEQLQRHALQRTLSLWHTLRLAYEGRLSLMERGDGTLRTRLSSLIHGVERARTAVAADPETSIVLVLERITADIGYETYIKNEYPEDYAGRLEDVQEFIQTAHILAQAEEAYDSLPQMDGCTDLPQSSLDRLLSALSLMSDAGGAAEATQSTVTISTIHSAKGLEWPVVFIPGVYHGSIPSARAEETEHDEERRLLYVAMTRAQALLYLSHPLKSARFESVVLSGFLAEPCMAHVFDQVGPRLTHKLLGEMANILGRSAPTQGPPVPSEDAYRDPAPGEGPRVLAGDSVLRHAVRQQLPQGAPQGFTNASAVLREAPVERLNVKKTVTKQVKQVKAMKPVAAHQRIDSFFVRPAPKPDSAAVATAAKSAVPAKAFEDHTMVLLSSSPDRIVYRRAKRKKEATPVKQPAACSSATLAEDAPPPYDVSMASHPALGLPMASSPIAAVDALLVPKREEVSADGQLIPVKKKRLGMSRPKLLPRV